MAATLARPLSPTRPFGTPRRVDPRLWVGGGLGIFAALGMLAILNQIVPTQQEVLQITRDLPAGATIQVADVTSVRVRMPESMVRDALGTLDVDRMVGARLAVPVHAGHLLTSSDLAAQTTTLPPGRTRLAIAWDPPAGAAADVNAGDTVIVYSTARQGAATATVVIDHARVVRVVRPQATVSSGTGSFATTGDTRSTSVVLNLDLDQAARLAAAAHTSLLDLAPVAPVEDAP
jgi:Flp pilus assembly protein CpaB